MAHHIMYTYAWRACTLLSLQVWLTVFYTALYGVSLCIIACTIKASTKLTVHTTLHSMRTLRMWCGLVLTVWTAALAASVTVLAPAIGATILQLIVGYEVRTAHY
jgi:hypothetical protein